MKLTVKTVKGQDFKVDVEEEAVVINVKARIEEQMGEAYPKDNLLLIHKGKVLSNEATLASSGVSEDSFVVVMVSKAKKQTGQASGNAAGGGPSAQTETQPTEPVSQPSDDQASGQKPVTEAVEEQPRQSPAAVTPVESTGPPPESVYGAATSTLATGAALEDSVRQICDMGFPKDQVVQAMRAAFNNPDRAVEYLMNGIPNVAEHAPPQRSAPDQQQGQAGPESGQATGPNAEPLDMFGGQQGGAGGAPGGPLDHLRNDARFQTLRQMVAQNPQILQPMLQELGKNNPDLLQQITDNQQDFLRLLTEEPPQVAEAAEGLMRLAGQGGPPPVVAPQMDISPEDEAAIARLEQLGFDRALCIEAFFTCDKNEEMAANYLLEHGDDL